MPSLTEISTSSSSRPADDLPPFPGSEITFVAAFARYRIRNHSLPDRTGGCARKKGRVPHRWAEDRSLLLAGPAFTHERYCFGDFDVSNEMPQYTRDIVFCGYGNAVKFQEKINQMKAFFDPNTANEFRENLLRRNQVRFVFLTSAERQSIPALSEATFMKQVFSNHSVAIYAVSRQ
jgi:hypothetical protein